MNLADKITADFPRQAAVTWRMSLPLGLIFFALAVATPAAAYGQLELITNREAQCVFFGEDRKISVAFHNRGGTSFEGEIRTRIFQTSSATAVLISDDAWKSIRVPAEEIVLASVPLDFPAVKAKTKFLIQWLENSNNIIGRTEVLICPTNLLAELKPLAGDSVLGVFDPQNQLKPLLKNLQIDFLNLENSGLENFSGKLALIGPFQSPTQMRDGLADQIKLLAKKGAAIVWLQPPSASTEKLLPSFYCVPAGTNAVVVVQPELVADLADNPQSQLNLIQFCKLALQPEPFQLPNLTIEP